MSQSTIQKRKITKRMYRISGRKTTSMLQINHRSNWILKRKSWPIKCYEILSAEKYALVIGPLVKNAKMSQGSIWVCINCILFKTNYCIECYWVRVVNGAILMLCMYFFEKLIVHVIGAKWSDWKLSSINFLYLHIGITHVNHIL